MKKKLYQIGMIAAILFLTAGCAEMGPLSLFSDANSSLVEEAISESQKGEGVADALMQKGQTGAALQIYENLISRTDLKDRAPLLLKHGNAANLSGQRSKATQSYEKLSYYKDHKCAAYMGLGDIQLKLGRPASASEAFASCLQVEPEHKKAGEWFAISQMFLTQDSKALFLLEGLAKSNPTDLSRQNNYATALLLQGEFIKAKEHLEIYAFSQKSNLRIRHNLSLTYAMLGDDVAAKHTALLDMPPDAAEVNLNYYRHVRESKDAAMLRSLLLGISG